MFSILWVLGEFFILDMILPQLFVNSDWDYYLAYAGLFILLSYFLMKFKKTRLAVLIIVAIISYGVWFSLLDVESLSLFPKLVVSALMLLISYRTHLLYYKWLLVKDLI